MESTSFYEESFHVCSPPPPCRFLLFFQTPWKLSDRVFRSALRPFFPLRVTNMASPLPAAGFPAIRDARNFPWFPEHQAANAFFSGTLRQNNPVPSLFSKGCSPEAPVKSLISCGKERNFSLFWSHSVGAHPLARGVLRFLPTHVSRFPGPQI